MNGISITISDILAFCAFVSAVWGVVKIYKEIRKPQQDMKHQVETNEQRLIKLEEEVKDMRNDDRITLECLSALINHEIDGNGIENMKRVRAELQKHLIDR